RHTRSKRDWSSDVCSSDLKVMSCSNLISSFRTEVNRGLTPPRVIADRSVRSNPDSVSLIVPHAVTEEGPSETSTMVLERTPEMEIGRAACRQRGETSRGEG